MAIRSAHAPETGRFRAALLAALEEKDGNATRLQRVAETLVALALEGELPAIREIRDVVDGKAGGPAEGTVSIERIERIIVDPQDQDRAGVPSAAGARTL